MEKPSNALIPASEMSVAVDIDRPKEEIDRARGQAAKLVAICVTAYPASDKYQTEQAILNTVNLWANFFIDDDWRIVGLAVGKHVATSKWPPSIAEIREIMTELQSPDLIPPDEAWAIVARYIDENRDYGGWEHPERLFPPAIIRAVNAIGFSNLRDLRVRRYDHSGKKTGLDRVAFMQSYEPEYQRGRILAQIPLHLRQAITQTQTVFSGESRALMDSTDKYLTEKEDYRRDMYRRMEERQFQYIRETPTEAERDE